jgi:hypothetical protein
MKLNDMINSDIQKFNIKEQIQNLPLDIFTIQRIMELTIKANSYDMLNCYAKFNLPQAFAWNLTTEGGDYWLQVFVQLERHEYEKNQKNHKEN